MPNRELVTDMSLAKVCQSLRESDGSQPSCLLCPRYLAGMCPKASIEASSEDVRSTPVGSFEPAVD